MIIASGFRSVGGFLFDLAFALSAMSVVVALLRGLNIENRLIELSAIVIAAIYPMLVYRDFVPGLGRWALGLHRFKYADIEGYDGNGVLAVYEPRPAKVYSARTIVAAAIFTVVFLTANSVVGNT